MKKYDIHQCGTKVLNKTIPLGTFIAWFEKFVLNIHKILHSILINNNLDYLPEFLIKLKK